MNARFFLALLALTLSVRAAELFPFVLPWDDASPGVTNISDLIDKPAGGKGFVVAKDGHLFAGDKRIRFFGVNFCFSGNFPPKEEAGPLAARMAKFGINCVRLHHMDSQNAPNGLLQKDWKTIDLDCLDRLDYFIAQLKANGIYTNLNLHVGNPYTDVPKSATNYNKGVDNYYPAMIEQQRAYARALLTHVNPYTKLAYTADPAVAFIEINNENGLIMEWNNGSLEKAAPELGAELTKQWNAWLAKKYGTPAKLTAAWSQGEVKGGDEMLKNGDFSGGAANWGPEQNGGAKATFQPSADGMTITVEKPGKENYHVQLSQAGLPIAGSSSYAVTFRAKASAPRNLNVALGQAHAPWKGLGSRSVKLTTEWQDFDLILATGEGDDQARLSFSGYGTEVGSVLLQKVTLKPASTLGFLPGEELGKIEYIHKADLGKRTLGVRQDWNRFLIDTEVAYWTGMRTFIRNDLGAKALVVGSAGGFSPWLVQAQLDVVDAHRYWQHPHFPGKQWDFNNWTVKQEPMAGRADGGTLIDLASRRVAGKPFIVTEYNHALPNLYSAEAFLEVCAFGALQDWDGIFAFAYSHDRGWKGGAFNSFFDIKTHPAKMATLPTAVALFYRADLAPGPNPRIAAPTMEEAIESIRTGSSWTAATAYGIKGSQSFISPIGMRIRAADEPAPAPQPETPAAPDAGFRWDTDKKRMILATPRTAGVVGKITAGETIQAGALSVKPGETQLGFATITASVRQGTTFADAKQILLTATGHVENTDTIWKGEDKSSITKWGKAPTLCEGIPATITLTGLKTSKLKAYALDEKGQRGAEVPITVANGQATLEIAPAQKTLWWEVAAE